MKDVVIYIRSLYGCDEKDEEAIDFSTDGLYTYDGSTACLTYLETEVTGMEGTRTSVVVTPEKVVVDRDGTVTSRLRQRFNEHGGQVEIDYVLDMEHAFASRNRFRLTVKEQETGDRSNG